MHQRDGRTCASCPAKVCTRNRWKRTTCFTGQKSVDVCPLPCPNQSRRDGTACRCHVIDGTENRMPNERVIAQVESKILRRVETSQGASRKLISDLTGGSDDIVSYSKPHIRRDGGPYAPPAIMRHAALWHKMINEYEQQREHDDSG